MLAYFLLGTLGPTYLLLANLYELLKACYYVSVSLIFSFQICQEFFKTAGEFRLKDVFDPFIFFT